MNIHFREYLFSILMNIQLFMFMNILMNAYLINNYSSSGIFVLIVSIQIFLMKYLCTGIFISKKIHGARLMTCADIVHL